MNKSDNIINFRDYQPGKKETIETHDLDAFRATLYDLGFLGPSSDTLDETEEVEPEEAEETESVSASETVEEPAVEVEVEETTDPAAEEVTSETDDESESESMVEETEPDDEPEVVESEEADDDSESDDEEEPEIVDEDDSDDDDFLTEDDEEDDDEEIEEEPDKLKAPGESLNTPLSDLIIRETERGFRRFDSDESAVEDDDSDEEVVGEADFKEVGSDPEESSSEFEEEIPVSRRKKHKHAAPSGAGTRFFKKLGTSFADKILANFGFDETSDSQHEKKVETETKKAEKKASSSKSENHQFSSPLQKRLTEEIMSGNLSRLEEWIENKNVNKLIFLFSNNQVLSDWVQENETDIFLGLPDEVFNFILKKNKEDPEKKDDKDDKKES